MLSHWTRTKNTVPCTVVLRETVTRTLKGFLDFEFKLKVRKGQVHWSQQVSRDLKITLKQSRKRPTFFFYVSRTEPRKE